MNMYILCCLTYPILQDTNSLGSPSQEHMITLLKHMKAWIQSTYTPFSHCHFREEKDNCWVTTKIVLLGYFKSSAVTW